MPKRLKRSLQPNEVAELIERYKQLEYELCEREFLTFCKCAWRILEPSVKFKINWHHELIAEYLEAAYKREIKRLIINIPPRYTKSLMVSVFFPVWIWIHNPSERFMFASYSERLSTKHSIDRRALIDSKWFQDKWGNRIKFASDQNVKTEFQNTARGRMFATSFRGSATGLGGNFLIIDDPHDPNKALSQRERENDINAWKNKFSTRLDDKENGVIVLIMQRLHEGDLTGYFLKEGGWTHLKIKGISTSTKTYKFPLSGKIFKYKKGEVLHPEREDKAAIKQQKKTLGPWTFAAQYQQEPAPVEGGIWKKEYWHYWETLPEVIPEWAQSWDLNIKEGGTSYCCGQVWAIVGPNRYLVDQVRGKWGFVELIRQIKELSAKWPQATRKIIEAKANAHAAADVLKNTLQGITLFDPQGDKITRAMAVEPLIAAGNVFLPKNAPWLEEFLQETSLFPNADNDDQVDATSQLLIFYQQHNLNYDLNIKAKKQTITGNVLSREF